MAKTPKPDQSAAPAKRAPRSVHLADALGAAGWAGADRALADAAAELTLLQRAFEKLQSGDAAAVREAEEALFLLGQSLNAAVRKRGLKTMGAVGEMVRYDAAKHELQKASARTPTYVRIDTPGFARGAEVLVKARVSKAKAP